VLDELQLTYTSYNGQNLNSPAVSVIRGSTVIYSINKGQNKKRKKGSKMSMEGGNERNLNRKRQTWNERKNGRKWNQTGKIYIAERGGIKMTIRYRRIHVKILDTSFGYSPLALSLT
jgi:hypothetical protein